MSHAERKLTEAVEEAVPKLRIVVKRNGARNGTAKNGAATSSRLGRMELASLGWEPRRRRLAVK
jgi:hypothetical protein